MRKRERVGRGEELRERVRRGEEESDSGSGM